MEKDQLDSLATVAVGSEKIPPSPHSHYAPSEIYSSSESPPAYSRPQMKSTAVQIARIIAMTLIAISVIIGSFILAGAWLQARASCTPESIAAMQAQMAIQQQHQQGELFKRLQPEALIQDPIEPKESLQSLTESTSTNTQSSSSSSSLLSQESKDKKLQANDKDKFKGDNGNDNDSENEDDYDDSEFPPVHIKFPLQLDLDDLAGTLMQQARSVVSCVVERRRSDEFSDEDENQVDDNNSTDRPRVQRLSGERVSILCSSGDPRRTEQQDQEMLTPIIVPLGPVAVPMQSQEQDYHRYQVQNQFPVPELIRPSFQNREMNQVDNRMIPDIRNIPQIMEMITGRFGPQINHHQPEIRPVPIELRPVPIEMIRGMRPPMDQEQQQQPIQMTFGHEHVRPNYHVPQDQQPQGMVPPPPPPPQSHQSPMMPDVPDNEARIIPQMVIHQQIEQRPAQSQENMEKSPFGSDDPLGFRRIIQQVPLEIRNIIQHITGVIRPADVPEGARREEVQEFKPFPGNARPLSMASFLPIEVKNLLETGNIEGRRQNDYDDQSDQMKAYPSGQDQSEKEDHDDEERKQTINLPAGIRNIIHQVVEGRAIAVPTFEMSMGPDSMEIPIGASAQVMMNAPSQEERGQQQPQQPQPPQQQQQQQPQLVAPEDVPQQYQQLRSQEDESRRFPQPRVQEDQSQQYQQQPQLQDDQAHSNPESQPQLLAEASQEHVMVQRAALEEANRPHYLQPRSVRSARSIPDALAHPREKRVRRCDCACK